MLEGNGQGMAIRRFRRGGGSRMRRVGGRSRLPPVGSAGSEEARSVACRRTSGGIAFRAFGLCPSRAGGGAAPGGLTRRQVPLAGAEGRREEAVAVGQEASSKRRIRLPRAVHY